MHYPLYLRKCTSVLSVAEHFAKRDLSMPKEIFAGRDLSSVGELKPQHACIIEIIGNAHFMNARVVYCAAR